MMVLDRRLIGAHQELPEKRERLHPLPLFLPDLPSGALKLRVEAPGHAAEIVEVTVVKDITTPVDVNLRKDR